MKKLIIRIQLYFLRGQYIFFDLLSDITNANKYFVRKKIYIGVAIIALSVIYSCSSSESKKVNVKKKDSLPEVTTTCYMIITPTSEIKDSTKKKNKIVHKAKHFIEPPIELPAVDESMPMISCYDGSASPPEAVPIIIETDRINNDTFPTVEKKPEFPGGIDSMRQFIHSNLIYPKDALEMGVEGLVILQFVVTKKGEIENLKITRSTFPSLDEEAIRIVRLMPKWYPGKQDGKDVNVYCTMPISFKIENGLSK